MEPLTLTDLVRRPHEAGEGPAILDADGALGYDEMWQRVAATRALLTDRGVRHGDRVGLYFHRSADYVTSLLATLAAGAVAVPVDPEYPADRIEQVLRAAAPALVLHAGDRPHRDAAERPAGWAEVTGAPGTGHLLEGAADPAPARREGDWSREPALILFTSGSTGRPKGVVLHHAGVANRLAWADRRYDLAADDRVLHKASIAFDASLHEILSPLIAGGTLVIAPAGLQFDGRGLALLMQDAGVTTAHFVPTMLRHMLDEPELEFCTDLRRVFCGGEPLDMALVRRLRALHPQCALYNQYGPTEASLSVSYWDASEPFDGRTAPLGRAIDGLHLHVLAPDMTPVADGEQGELWIGGVGVGLGYLDEAQTAQRFRPDPSGASGGLLYRTGDLVSRSPAGFLEFRGRVDEQVKVRGVRVEPGEVAAVLRDHPRVSEAAVTGVPDEVSGVRLVAYVVARPGGPLGAAELRAHAGEMLPPAMQPQQVVFLDALPRLPNGKVARHELPDPPAPGRDAPHHTEAGEGTAAARLREIWRQTLGVDTVTDDDDFVALGGHSLTALRISARAREEAGVAIPPGSCLQAATFGEWLGAAGLGAPA